MDTEKNIKVVLQNMISGIFQIPLDKIKYDTPLIHDGLYFNSIQAIELSVMIEEYYKNEFPKEVLKEDIFKDINTLAKTIQEYF